MRIPKLKSSYGTKRKKAAFQPQKQLQMPTYQGRTLPEVTVYGGRKRNLNLPSLNDMIAPKPVEEYAKDYFRQILGVPQLPSLGEYLFDDDLYQFCAGKMPTLRIRL